MVFLMQLMHFFMLIGLSLFFVLMVLLKSGNEVAAEPLIVSDFSQLSIKIAMACYIASVAISIIFGSRLDKSGDSSKIIAKYLQFNFLRTGIIMFGGFISLAGLHELIDKGVLIEDYQITAPYLASLLIFVAIWLSYFPFSNKILSKIN